MPEIPGKTEAKAPAAAGKEAGAPSAPHASGVASAIGTSPTSPDEGFDRVLERLRGVVEKLETGSLGLEQSLSAFEEGVRLSRRGAEILDRAERRVELLLRGDEGGGDRVVPFPGGTQGGGEGAGDGDGP